MAKTSYAIALGSNRRHGRYGTPERALRAAITGLDELGEVKAVSRLRYTLALGPAGRSFANAAVILESGLDPASLLEALKAMEKSFGRRPGRPWGPRVLDLDIILWSGGCWSSPGLSIPHPAFRSRAFVLEPLADIAPRWRDPISGRTVRQLRARLRARRG